MRSMENASAPSVFRRILAGQGFWVILLGAALRLFAWQQTWVVNPDGTLYIHQARALYHGLWGQVTPCGTGFLSNYAFFIAGAFPFFGDWIQAARAVSILFGSLTLVPLYLLLRRFFDETVSALGVLVFSIMPVLVGRSVDVVRDPVYWFFLVLGMYFLINPGPRTDNKNLIYSSLSLLMASWARVEALAAVLASAVFLMVTLREARLKKLALFLTPFFGVSLLSFAGAWIYGWPPSGLYRSYEILEKASGPLSHYRLLRIYLADMVQGVQDPLVRHFLPESRNFVWLIALGTFANRALEAFFYPLFAVFVIGAFQGKRRFREDPRLLYFLFMIAAGAGLLYLHILHWWILDNRHMALVIFPAAVFAGLGMERIRLFLQSRYGLTNRTVFWVLFAVLMAFTLPKNLQSREKDKVVFKEIGERAAQVSGNGEEIRVAASMDTLRWFSFYANLSRKGAPCPQPYNDFHALVGNSYGSFLGNLRQNGAHFFLWEERHWPPGRFDFLKRASQADFKEIGRWKHPDTGRMILFQLKTP